ncbi:hypothetical protein Plhal703r1_c09g0047841 [Plasmopara halstedii]
MDGRGPRVISSHFGLNTKNVFQSRDKTGYSPDTKAHLKVICRPVSTMLLSLRTQLMMSGCSVRTNEKRECVDSRRKMDRKCKDLCSRRTTPRLAHEHSFHASKWGLRPGYSGDNTYVFALTLTEVYCRGEATDSTGTPKPTRVRSQYGWLQMHRHLAISP